MTPRLTTWPSLLPSPVRKMLRPERPWVPAAIRNQVVSNKKGTARHRSFSAFCLNDYLNETSSMRKVVERETSVVERNCSRIV
jgi:hypothetical protein